jgi:hypothetical protein
LVKIFVTVLFRLVNIENKESKNMTRTTLKTNPHFSGILMPQAEPSPKIQQRLIVLVPVVDGDDAELARRVWAMAVSPHLQVLFLSLCPDPAEEPRLRRRLIGMALILQNEYIPVEVRIDTGDDWVQKTLALRHPSDIVVCQAEHKIGIWGLSLGRLLKSNLSGPVYVLSGLYPRRRVRPGLLTEAICWAGSVMVVVAFFWLQVKLGMLSNDWAHTSLLYISVPVEVWLIWTWNSLLG